MADLRPYSKIRDTGLSWLGELPDHWAAPRLKVLFREVDERSGTGTEPLLSLRMREGLVDSREAGGKPIPAASLTQYKVTHPGELVMNRMRAATGLFGLPPKVGLVSPDYAVFRPRTPVNLRYFLSLFRSPDMMSIFRLESHGLGTGASGFLRLYTEQFGKIQAPLPPLAEQAAIVRFLEHADRRIRRYIRAKQNLIKLLEEQKQAIIQRAVTRGLDPAVRLKPSGVEWLGQIPDHWQVMLNGRLFRETIRPHEGRPETQLSLSQKDGLVATNEMQERSLQTSSYDNWKVVVPGDLVLNRFKAHLGVFFAAGLRGIVSFHYGVFSSRRLIVPKYFEFLFHTTPYRTIYAGQSNGMTVGLQNLSNQSFYGVRSILPPLVEQQSIVAYVEDVTKRLDEARDLIVKDVQWIREYRTRLIADVGTCKLDVREAAARMPDEISSPEGVDDVDETEDTEADTGLDQGAETEGVGA